MRPKVRATLCTVFVPLAWGCVADAPKHSARAAAESQPSPKYSREVDFAATVLDCVMIDEFSGTVCLAAVDPLFVLTVQLEGDCGALGWKAGQTVHLAVHSPTELFGLDEYIDDHFTFRLYRREDDGRGYWLEVL
jgi:hypothetical protein